MPTVPCSRLASLGFATFALIGLALSAPAWAGMTLTGKPKLEFQVVGNLVNVDGSMTGATIVDDGTTLTFTVPVSTVDTGINLRDEHIKKNFVHAEQHPNVTLVIPKASVTWPSAVGESTTGTVNATFTASEGTHEYPVTFTVKKTKDAYKVDAKFDWEVTNHGIETSEMSYMGVSFETTVHSKITLELVDAP